jgi:hypothetical protein
MRREEKTARAPTRDALDGLAQAVRARLDAIRPKIVMGDDDSVHLTARQQGEKDALSWVLSRIGTTDR